MKHIFNTAFIMAALCASVCLAVAWQWMYWVTSSTAVAIDHEAYRSHLAFFCAACLICCAVAYLTRPRS